MNENLKQYLEKALDQLTEAQTKIVAQHTWSKQSESIDALKELVKEQLTHEDSRHSTRQAR